MTYVGIVINRSIPLSIDIASNGEVLSSRML